MKIRTRLSLWYLSATLAVVLIFSLGVYVTMRHLLFRALERECEVIITVIENSYDPATKTFQNLESKQLFINEHMDHSHVIVLDPFERIVYRSPFAHRLGQHQRYQGHQSTTEKKAGHAGSSVVRRSHGP